jgi:16S rRNA (guanine527-N7)-methyltransferase
MGNIKTPFFLGKALQADLEAISKLKNTACVYKVNLTDQQCVKIIKYIDYLLQVNEYMNLTAITDINDVIIKHVIDSLMLGEYIKNQYDTKNLKIIDVGTGAGLPGIILAIYLEESNITLLDSLNKRVEFLKDTIELLGLNNVTAIHARAEEQAHAEKYREAFDIAVARAVAGTNILLELLSGYIKVNGKCMLMKSELVNSELDLAKNAIEKLSMQYNSIYDYELHSLNTDEKFTRNIVNLTKKGSMNSKYPRQFAKIKKQPL